MGAQNSTAQTVPIMNPNPHKTENERIEIGPEVALRLSTAKREHLYGESKSIVNTKCACNCGQEIPSPQKELSAQDALLYKSAVEMQEEEFAKTLDSLERMFGKPMEWSPENRGEVNKRREEVLNCYKRHKQEPLLCYQLAEDFQNYVFKEQMVNMLKQQEQKDNKQHEKEEYFEKSSTKKRASKCGGKSADQDSNVDTGIEVGGSCKDPDDPPDLHDVKHEWQQEEETNENAENR